MKKTESITAAAFLLAASMMLSRVLGYVREMLLAYKFGASETTDAFYAAFQIPDLMNYFLAGGALSIAFIPLYNKTLASEGEEAARHLMHTILGTMGAVAAVVTAALWWKAESLIRFQFPNFDEDTMALTIHLTRIVLPAQIFFITGGIIQAVLMAHKDFRAAALAPLIYNGCTILGGSFLYDAFGIDGFAYGTLLGAVLGPFLMPLLFSRGAVSVRAKFNPKDKKFLVYLALAAPLMFGQTLLTLDEWYGRWFGALLSSGTVAHLAYARRLMQVPIAVIGQAVAAAALPTLSKLWAEKRVDEMNETLLRTLRAGLALATLAGAATWAMSHPLVNLVYRQGAFGSADGWVVGILTAILSLAVPAWIVQQIAVRGFYARSDTWRPMVLGTVISIAVIPLYLYLMKAENVFGLAFAGVIAMSINTLATLFLARGMHKAPPLLPLLATLGRSLAIGIAAGCVARAALTARSQFLPMIDAHVKITALADLAAGGAAFAFVAMAGLLLIGDAELKRFLKRFMP